MPVPVEDGCYSFGTSSSPFGFQYSYPHYLYRVPCFNPQNSDQFVYGKEDKENFQPTELRLHTISTGSDVLLTTGILGAPHWHSNGWILFTKSDNNIWKIKANGDSLTLLTLGGINYGPRWNPVGDRFVYCGDNLTIIADPTGAPVDTIAGFMMLYGDWSPDGTKISTHVNVGSDYGVAYYDFGTGNTTVVATVPQGQFIGESRWAHDSHTLYWQTKQGFYKTDITTGTTAQIKPSCDSKYWWSFQFSGDGTKMIWERADSRLTGSDHNTIYQQNFIFLLNPDGTGEQKIDL